MKFRKSKSQRLPWGWNWANNLFRTTKKCRKVGHKWRFYDRHTRNWENARFICARCERIETFKMKNPGYSPIINFGDFICEETTARRLLSGITNSMSRCSAKIVSQLKGLLTKLITLAGVQRKVILKSDLR